MSTPEVFPSPAGALKVPWESAREPGCAVKKLQPLILESDHPPWFKFTELVSCMNADHLFQPYASVSYTWE